MKRQPKSSGFTLIEVVVAVAVIALGLAATIKTVSTVTKNTAYLNERMVATWVAQNALAEFELNIKNNANENTSGQEELAGIRWYWTKTLADTGDPGIRRVQIEVRRDRQPAAQVYASLVTLLPVYFEESGNEF